MGWTVSALSSSLDSDLLYGCASCCESTLTVDKFMLRTLDLHLDLSLHFSFLIIYPLFPSSKSKQPVQMKGKYCDCYEVFGLVVCV